MPQDIGQARSYPQRLTAYLYMLDHPIPGSCSQPAARACPRPRVSDARAVCFGPRPCVFGARDRAFSDTRAVYFGPRPRVFGHARDLFRPETACFRSPRPRVSNTRAVCFGPRPHVFGARDRAFPDTRAARFGRSSEWDSPRPRTPAVDRRAAVGERAGMTRRVTRRIRRPPRASENPAAPPRGGKPRLC
jgi:hypothetical protein